MTTDEPIYEPDSWFVPHRQLEVGDVVRVLRTHSKADTVGRVGSVIGFDYSPYPDDDDDPPLIEVTFNDDPEPKAVHDYWDDELELLGNPNVDGISECRCD